MINIKNIYRFFFEIFRESLCREDCINCEKHL